jgi:VanZ family protein
MLIIFMFSSIPSESMPTFGRYDLPVKKFGHAAGYALLAGSIAWGWARYDPKSIGLAWLLTVLYAASDELHQAFVPGRNASLMDIGIDALGALVGLVPAFYLWLQSPRTNNLAKQKLFPKL